MQLPIFFQTFDRGDLLAGGATNLSNARTGRLSVEQDRAGAALPFAASVLAAGKAKIVSQDAEETNGGIYVDRHLLSVDI